MVRCKALVAMLAALLAVGLPARAGTASTGGVSAGRGAANPICGRLGHSIEASAGAQMYCFGAQQNGPGTAVAARSTPSSSFTASATRRASPILATWPVHTFSRFTTSRVW